MQKNKNIIISALQCWHRQCLKSQLRSSNFKEQIHEVKLIIFFYEYMDSWQLRRPFYIRSLTCTQQNLQQILKVNSMLDLNFDISEKCVSNKSIIQTYIIQSKKSMAASNERLKTVENYILERIRYINLDQSEIWVARHKILKKNYMMKRVPYVKNSDKKIASFENDDELNAFKLKKITFEIEVLKQLKINGSPKCQKLIKTSNSVYIVYDEFPKVSLRQFVKSHQLLHEQRLTIMINLSKTLLNYHKYCITFLLLSPQNIFLSENQELFLSQWSSIVYKNNSSIAFPTVFSKKSQFVANEVLEESRCSPASDIYSLGKIFTYLADQNKKITNSRSQIFQLRTLIQQMTDKDDLKRPPLTEVIERLEKINKEIQQKQKIDLTQSKGLVKSKIQSKPSITYLRTVESQISLEKNSELKKAAMREKNLLQGKEVKTSRLTSTYSFDSILIGMSRAISRPSLSRARKSSDVFVRKTNKTRNLSYFIIGLSDFALKWPEGEALGYLLLKQSYLILNSCYNEWSNEDFQDKNSKTLAQILKEQIVQLNLSLNMLKEYLQPQKCDQQFKSQLRNDITINERYYKDQIIAFCNKLIDQFNTSIRANKVKNLNELVDNLFSMYMILKREEEGSFEKYWDKIYCSQFAFLKNQIYFEEQKKLGYRYLRSKIVQILNKK